MVESWLRAHRGIVLATTVALAIGVRVGTFVELNGGPCFALVRWDATDMHFVDEWARTIAGGDWLTDQALHPFHPWARELLAAYMALHEEVAERLPGHDSDERARYLWNVWNRGKTFHEEPLYAYLVAVTYALFGPDVRWVFVWQLAAGVGATVLLHLAVRPAFGDAVATIAALLVALAGPLVYNELLLLPGSLVAATGVALLWLTERARRVRHATGWLALGIALGAAFLLKTSFLVYAAGVVVALVAGRRAAAAAPVAALVAGIALALVPLVARNVVVGVPPLAVSGVDGLLFLETNAVDFRPGVGFVVSDFTRETLGDTEGALWPTVQATLRTHPDRESVERLLAAKFATVWHWHEIPNNANFYYFRLDSAVLRVLPVTFLVLSPLGLVGLVLGLPAFRRAWPLYLLVACHVTGLLVFYTLSSLRIPLLPALAPFAALTLVELGRSLATVRVPRAAAVAGATAVVAVWTARPLPPGMPLVGTVDYWAAYHTYWKPLIEDAQRAGDERRAADVFRASLAFEPPSVRAVDAGHPPPDDATRDLVNLFASVHDAYGEELVRAGRADDGQREAERARELTAAARVAS